MAIRVNADGSISVGILPEKNESPDTKGEAEKPAEVSKKKSTKKTK